MPYPWGREDTELREHYRKLGMLRNSETVFADGDFDVKYAEGSLIVYERSCEERKIIVIANASDYSFEYTVDGEYTDVLSGNDYNCTVLPLSCVILSAKRQ